MSGSGGCALPAGAQAMRMNDARAPSGDRRFGAGGLVRAIGAIIAAGGGSEAREALHRRGEPRSPDQPAGHDSHGVGMIPRYVESLLEGGLRGEPAPGSSSTAARMLGSTAARATAR